MELEACPASVALVDNTSFLGVFPLCMIVGWCKPQTRPRMVDRVEWSADTLNTLGWTYKSQQCFKRFVDFESVPSQALQQRPGI